MPQKLLIRKIRTGWNMSWDKYESSYIIAYPPEYIVDSIISWGYDNIPCDHLFIDESDPSFGRENNIHITILGNIEETNHEKIKNAISIETKFVCPLGKIQLFTNNSKYDVIQIEAKCDQIFQLHKSLSQSIKNVMKFPLYVPHVTIAYVKKGYGDKFLDNTYFVGQEFMIDKLVLSCNLNDQFTFKLGKT